jgi:hypothetical protein
LTGSALIRPRVGRQRRPLGSVVLAVAVSVLVGGSIAQLSASVNISLAAVAVWLAAVLVGAVAWRVLRHRSPVGLVLTAGFLLFGVGATVLYHPTAEEFAGINSLPAYMAVHTASYRYLLVFLVASAATLAGSILGSRANRGPHAAITGYLRLNLPNWLLIAAVFPLLIHVYGIGLPTLFHAEKYLAHEGPSAALSVGQALGPVGVLICGYFTFRRGGPPVVRLFAITLALAYEVTYFGVATRLFAIWIPLMFAGGLLSGAWQPGRQRLLLGITIVLTLIAVQVPLNLRVQPEHGIAASWKYLSTQPGSVFGTYNPFNNVLFGAPLSLYVGEEVPRLPSSDLATATNPLPSGFTNWNSIKDSLRVNVRVPFSAVGELLNFGWVALVAVLFVVSGALSYLGSLAARRRDLTGGACSLILLGAAALFVVQATEYNLRSVCRTFYYTAVVVGLILLVSAIRQPASPGRGVLVGKR